MTLDEAAPGPSCLGHMSYGMGSIPVVVLRDLPDWMIYLLLGTSYRSIRSARFSSASSWTRNALREA